MFGVPRHDRGGVDVKKPLRCRAFGHAWGPTEVSVELSSTRKRCRRCGRAKIHDVLVAAAITTREGSPLDATFTESLRR